MKQRIVVSYITFKDYLSEHKNNKINKELYFDTPMVLLNEVFDKPIETEILMNQNLK